MKNQMGQTILQMALGFVLFSLFFCGTVLMACVLTLVFIGPNLAGIGNILIPTVVAVPIAYILFFSLFNIKRFNWYVRYLIPALIFPIVFGITFGITMLERTPQNIFQVFVSKPIPEGVSNIRAQDITIGIDNDIIVAFNTTSEALDEIITKNEFELVEDSFSFHESKSPHQFFPGVSWNDEWTLYMNCGESQSYCMWMWVNPEQTTVLYRYWSF